MKNNQSIFQFSGSGRVEDIVADLREICKQNRAIEHKNTRDRGYPDYYFEDLETGYLWKVSDTGDKGSGFERVDHYYYADKKTGPGPVWTYLPPTYLSRHPDLLAQANRKT